MRIKSYSIDKMGSGIIQLGQQGENRATEFQIDVSSWLKEWPNGEFSAMIKTPSGQYKPLSIYLDGNILHWVVTGSETAEHGIGTLEIRLTNDDGAIVKSCLISCSVSRAIMVNPYDQSAGGEAETALRLAHPREIQIIGGVSGASMFDGSTDIQINTVVSTLSNEELEEILK